jgi:lysine-specific demethylase 8
MLSAAELSARAIPLRARFDAALGAAIEAAKHTLAAIASGAAAESAEEHVVALEKALAGRGNETCTKRVQASRDAWWARIHSVEWRAVPDTWRDAYAAACVALCQEHAHTAQHTQPPTAMPELMERVLRELDLALLVGGPALRRQVQSLASAAQAVLEALEPPPQPLLVDKLPRLPLPSLDPERCVPRVAQPLSLAAFERDWWRPRRPVLLEGACAAWPAVQLWRDLSYLRRRAGARTVPVEEGGSYAAATWRQKLTPLRAFIDAVAAGRGAEEAGYLAQHALFDQVPELRRDVLVPDYCAVGGDDAEVEVNAWFGPAGTVSPLHFDPQDNLLAQAVGFKYVRLYAQDQSPLLYANPDPLLANTSLADVGQPDAARFPLLPRAVFCECLLGPGDMLFIPARTWHYVRALSVSFSVSFWWG